MWNAKNKGRLIVAGILLAVFIVMLIAIGNGIYQTAPGPRVDYSNIAQFAGKKVTVQGKLGNQYSTVTVNEGADAVDYFDEYLFYPNPADPSETIFLRYKPSNFASFQPGDSLTVIGQVIVEKDQSIHVEVFRMYK